VYVVTLCIICIICIFTIVCCIICSQSCIFFDVRAWLQNVFGIVGKVCIICIFTIVCCIICSQSCKFFFVTPWLENGLCKYDILYICVCVLYTLRHQTCLFVVIVVYHANFIVIVHN